MPSQPVTDFEALVNALCSANVRFVLIGGLAMRMHGSAHITEDIDIYYLRSDQSNLEKMTTALAPHHPKLRGAPEDIPFIFDVRTFKFAQNLTLVTDLGEIDLLGDIGLADSFEDLWERSVPMTLFGHEVRVASIPDLIRMKETANRLKDQNHILELRALQKLIDTP